MKKKFFSAFFILIFFSQLTFAEKIPLQDIVFEITRYCITGVSGLPSSQYFAAVSMEAAKFSSRRIYTNDGGCRTADFFCDYHNRSKIGIIESSFSIDDVFNYEEFTAQLGNKKGDWVDQAILISKIPEKSHESLHPAIDEKQELKGEDILAMLDNKSGEARIETPEVNELLEEVFFKRNGEIRKFTYDGEEFTFYEKNGEKLLVNNYKNRIVRRTFDTSFRLSKSEIFKFEPTSKNLTLENEKIINYFPNSSIISSTIENLKSVKLQKETFYDEKGRPEILNESHWEDEVIPKKKKSKKSKNVDEAAKQILVPDKKSVWTYDDKNRILSEEFTNWYYKESSSGSKISDVEKIKNVYDYSKDSGNPDLSFYENDELRLKREFNSTIDYTETMFFDEGYSVKVVYKDGIKVTEIIMIDNMEVRRRNFDVK